ncbi:hypothetical protein HYU07_00160 [Candidatus Woesearchaeota archaeon]|nr:hypothetical protein [Candidatus Woesearchaeota archaeon]
MFKNKKAGIDLSLKTIISLVLAAIFLALLFWLIVTIYSAFIPKLDLATLNTFEQILAPAVEKATPDKRYVPYYIEAKFELVSRVAAPSCCDKCLCILKEGDDPGLFYTKKRFKFNIVVEGYDMNMQPVQNVSVISGYLRKDKGPNGGNVKNVAVWKEGNTVHIKDT